VAEFDSKGRRLISIVRVIEYHGTDEWIQATMAASRIPWQGVVKGQGKLPEGCEIKSGLVVWNIEEAVAEEPRPVIPIPPGSTPV
jgi:hypothetical protein